MNAAKNPVKTLSRKDIERLMSERSVKAQMDVVEKLTDLYTSEGPSGLNAEQRAIANDIFNLLLSRAETTVRAMLSMQLSQATNIPHDLAKQMAKDVNEVASPVLQYSDVLNDADLMDIVHSMVDTQKLESIAQRDRVSEAVSEVLVSTNLDNVVNTLIRNEGAAITEKTFEKIVQHYNDNPEVMESVVQRSDLPVAVVEKMVAHISNNVRRHLEDKYGNLSEVKAMRHALDKSLELASVKMMGFDSSNEELKRILGLLGENDSLSPLAAIGICDLKLFTICLSRNLKVPVSNIEILLHDSTGFKTLYEQAKLPPNLYKAVHLAVEAIIECEEEAEQKSGAKTKLNSAQVIERMEALSRGKKIEGAEYIYKLMGSKKV